MKNSDSPMAQLPCPTDAQRQWQDCELGALLSFDISAYLEEGWRWDPAYTRALDPNVYAPEALDTDQWLEAAKAMGVQYAVFTATHMGGFRQWQSENWPYGLRQTRWRNGKADVVREFIESCHRYGIRPGLFVSVRFNAYWHATYPVPLFRGTGMMYGQQANTELYQAYLRSCEQMVEELCSRYGDILELWFDGGVMPPEEGGPDVLPIFERHQPGAMFYHSRQRADHRWAGAEDGTAGDPCWATITDVTSQYGAHKDAEQRKTLLRHGDPNGKSWVPAMADVPLRNHEWFWRREEEGKLYSPDDLLEMYFASVGRNANLIIGLTPDSQGVMPDADMAVCEEFGRKLQEQFRNVLAETSARESVVELPFPRPSRVDKLVIVEDIAQGHRIRAYVLEAVTAGDGDWVEVARGTSVGHKRIERFPARELAKVRLRITESVGKPTIRRFAAYGPG